MDISDDFTSNAYILIFSLLLAGAATVLGNYRRRHRRIELPDSSVLLAYYTEGGSIVPTSKGKIGKLRYSTILSVNLDPAGGSNFGAYIYRVELPFNASVHLLGIPKRAGAAQLDPDSPGSIMERVSLEGDYDKYFSLFSEKGMQTQARYVMNPEAMEFTVDFCQSNNWEILSDELYFVQAFGTGAKDDTTAMFTDITKFVEQITPRLAEPLSDKQLREQASYGEDRRDSLTCPICSAAMPQTDSGYFSCPEGHGELVPAKLLNKRVKIVAPGSISGPVADKNAIRTLKCPSCGAAMDHVAFNASATFIDVCSSCPYRWLDTGEDKLAAAPSP